MSRAHRASLVALLSAFWLSCGGGGGGPYLVGAHYYVWYPSNFRQGYLRAALRPAESPELGEYSSRSAAVAEAHIGAAVSHGIDFFSLDWWPNRPAQNAADRVGRGLADGHLRMVLVTSWNEWNEDTAIEPLAPAPPTANDVAGGALTQGYTYEGFGSTYINLVRVRLGG